MKTLSIQHIEHPAKPTKHKPRRWTEAHFYRAMEFWRSEYGHFNSDLYQRIKEIKARQNEFIV
jgi:hypothetical protein